MLSDTAKHSSTGQLFGALAAVEAASAVFDVEEVPLPVAARLVEALVHGERVLGALRLRLAHRLAEAGGHAVTGDRDAASFLARVSGTSAGKAKAELALAQRLAALPEVAQAYGEGRLSPEQAQVVAGAAGADPRATSRLLEAAEAGSFTELKGLAARTERAASREEDEVARERRLHERRYCRTWTPAEGGLRVDAHLTAVEGARLLSALTTRTDQLRESSDEPPERLRADALVELCCGKKVDAHLVVRADASALVRGEVEGDEVCEVDGVGPLSVTVARSLLGEAFLTLLVQKGIDIATVTSTTRVIPRKVRLALLERDRCCVVPGCGATFNLQIDHWRVDYARGGLTALDNLCRLCATHHKLKTQRRLLLGGGPGKWFVTTPTRGGP